MAASVIFLGLIFAQTLTLVGFLTTLGGLASLQKQANSLHIADITNSTAQAALVNVYDSTFTAGLLNPYPYNPGWQFEYQWFALWFEFAIFIWIDALIIFPAYILRLKATALAFVSAALVLIFENVNAVLFFKRSNVATVTFGQKRIETTLAGLIIVGIANGLSILFLGILGTGSDRTGIDEAAAHERERGRAPAEDKLTYPIVSLKTDSAEQVPRRDIESST
jgi:hypothetical protein